MTSDPIRAAIGQLQASLASLPAARRTDWSSHVGFVNASGGEPVADARPSYTADAAGIAAYIALTASPHVTEALIALLQALHDHGEQGPVPDDVQNAVDVLATAITRRPE